MSTAAMNPSPNYIAGHGSKAKECSIAESPGEASVTPAKVFETKCSLITSKLLLQACCILVPLFLMHCSSTKEAQQTSQPPAPISPEPPRPQFETRKDTIATQSSSESGGAGTNSREQEIRFMVQIGAFKDPQKASSVQTVAREQLHMPVLNDYNTALGLYQIRIGFFETYGAAQAFRLRIQEEFPNDYKDSWIVQLKR